MYSDVPKDYDENLLWRAWINEQLIKYPHYSDLIIKSCMHDIRFYVGTFCWTLDTRKEEPVRAFIPYDYQEVLLLLIVFNIRQSQKMKNWYRRWDVGIDKSRRMGISWTVLYSFDWFWRFDRNRHFRCISSKEERVDGKDDEDALFPKLDFNEERLPPCLSVRGAQHDHAAGRPSMMVFNRRRRTSIRGEASSKNAGRGGGNSAVMRDEEAFAEFGSEITKSLQPTTKCQIRVSTPNGAEGSFWQAKQNLSNDWFTFHWSINPDLAAGLYESKNGKIRVIDKKWHEENPDYNFRIEQTHADPGTPFEFLRSPWFDGEVDASDSIYNIQQEVQISYLGTGSPFFHPVDKLLAAKIKNVRDPIQVGQLEDFLPPQENGQKQSFSDRDMRRDKCKLWFQPSPQGLVPQDTTYSMGIDMGSGGGGKSDSVISVGDDTIREKVFEFRSNGITPEDLARLTVAVYDWFSTHKGVPYAAWDGGGPGVAFGAKFMEFRPDADVYYYKSSNERKAHRSNKPGVPSNQGIKYKMFVDYKDALFRGTYVTRCVEAYDQAQQFRYDGRGGVVHILATTTEDKSETGQQHGDITTSEVILLQAMRERPEPVPRLNVFPVGSFGARWAEYDEQAKREKEEVYSW